MKIQFIQHSAADRPAAAAEIALELGHQCETVRIDREDPIPESVEADVLMLFGGAISFTTSAPHPPWVQQEQALIREYVNQDRRVLGICLGSQMIATALGASVRRNEQPEVGFHPIRQTEQASEMISDVFPREFTAFHWHQDTFGIPDGAVRVFESDACTNQGFSIDDRVFGFQFHLEADEKTVRTFVAVSSLKDKEGPYVQSESSIFDGTDHLQNQRGILEGFLRRFLA
jgi:GMP synthase-like glutamine amidotransferase